MLKMIEFTMSSANEPSNCENNIKIKNFVKRFQFESFPIIITCILFDN